MKQKKYNFAPPSTFLTQDFSTECADQINQRIQCFKKQPMHREVNTVKPDEIIKHQAFKMDPHPHRLHAMIEVREIGDHLHSDRELQQAREYFRKRSVPEVWQAYLEMGEGLPYHFEEVSFINLFSDRAIGILDIYRPPWKEYYTSDVFFSQWLEATGKPLDVNHLPDAFPKTMYINNVTNVLTIDKLKPLVDAGHKDHCQFDPNYRPEWKSLKQTPHFKFVEHVLDAYNRIKNRKCSISGVQLYRKMGTYNIKLTVL